jgi:hypothetical protein
MSIIAQVPRDTERAMRATELRARSHHGGRYLLQYWGHTVTRLHTVLSITAPDEPTRRPLGPKPSWLRKPTLTTA